MDKAILSELRSVLLERVDLSNIPEEVWKRSSALNTWGTNAIEGSTITWNDAKKILLEERSIKDRPIRDVLETVQHERTFRGMVERMKHPINLITILELHEGVFRGVLPDAGMWRRVNVRIEGANFTPPRMEKVIPMMEDLISEYHVKDTMGDDVFRVASWSHYNFETIHPFRDGNGRVGRLLMNLHLLKHNWPPIHILPNDRDDYLDALASAGVSDLDPLTSMIERLMGSSLLDLLDGTGTAEDELMDLKRASSLGPYDPNYLGLRCKQGELPGVLSGHRWMTSERALKIYMDHKGRK
ncbi:MAG: Fic family protein [Thermoplasmata archaeon]|nr:Fic family protein [Thermoplasmata archaeon]